MKETAERIVKQLNPVFVRHAVVVGNGIYDNIDIEVQGVNGLFKSVISIDKKGIWNGVRYVNEDRALALLEVHQEDWERAHPELVREMEWADKGDGLHVIIYAGRRLSAIEFCKTSSTWGISKSAKEEAMTAFIDYLKKNP